jgi:hypothetical protein
VIALLVPTRELADWLTHNVTLLVTNLLPWLGSMADGFARYLQTNIQGWLFTLVATLLMATVGLDFLCSCILGENFWPQMEAFTPSKLD